MNFNDFTPNSKFGVLLPNLELHDLCAQSCHLKTRFSFKQINEVYSFGRPHCWCWIDKPPTESWYALFIRPSTLLVLNRQTTDWILKCSSSLLRTFPTCFGPMRLVQPDDSAQEAIFVFYYKILSYILLMELFRF